jgi:hypothetical protein
MLARPERGGLSLLRDDSFDPRVVVRGNDQWDHATDRNAGKGSVFEIKLVAARRGHPLPKRDLEYRPDPDPSEPAIGPNA